MLLFSSAFLESHSCDGIILWYVSRKCKWGNLFDGFTAAASNLSQAHIHYLQGGLKQSHIRKARYVNSKQLAPLLERSLKKGLEQLLAELQRYKDTP